MEVKKKGQVGFPLGQTMVCKLEYNSVFYGTIKSNCLQAFVDAEENDKRSEFQEENEDVGGEPMRGTKSLSDIYQRCNVVVMEPEGYEEATTDQKWINAMKEELIMIEKK